MNVACPGCGTRYAVAEDKVRGRRVRISCKHCASPIVVDGTTMGSSVVPDPNSSKGPNPNQQGAPSVRRDAPDETSSKPRPDSKGANGAATVAERGLGTSKPNDNAMPAGIRQANKSAERKVEDGRAQASRTIAAVTSSPRVAEGAAARPAGSLQQSASPHLTESVAIAVNAPELAASVAAGGGKDAAAAVVPSTRPLARRAPRVARETIIGVAAPANAPAGVGLAPVAVPVPNVPPVGSVTTGPSTTPKAGAATESAAPTTNPRAPFGAQRAARSARQTIIGVAAPANAPNAPMRTASSTFNAVAKPAPAPAALGTRTETAKKPSPHRTIIGGLNAAPGSAPAPQAVGLGVPNDAKWNILIPKHGAVEMTAPELVRAFAEGKLTRDVNAWREGLDGWKPIHEIDSLVAVFQRAGIALNPVPNAGATPLPSRTKAKPPIAPGGPPEVGASSAASDVHASAMPGGGRLDSVEANSNDDEEVTRIAASPWDVPDVGAKAAEKLASSAGLPPRQTSITPSSAKPADHLDHPPLDRPSRRPDIGPRDTVRGQLAAMSSVPAPPPRDPAVTRPLPQPRIPVPTAPAPIAPPQTATGEGARLPPIEALATIPDQFVDPTPPTVNHPSAASTSEQTHPEDMASILAGAPSMAPPAQRRARGRWWLALLLFSLLAALLAWSYHSRRPRALYSQLHRLGWDAPIARAIDSTTTGIAGATRNYAVKPYRHIAEKLRKTLKK